MSWDIEKFRAKIEEGHDFPGIYLFKFIVPLAKKQELLAVLPEGKQSYKISSKETYISITVKAPVRHSQDVLDVYIRANKIEGCLPL